MPPDQIKKPLALLITLALTSCGSPTAPDPGFGWGKGEHGNAVVTPSSTEAALVRRMDPSSVVDARVEHTVPFGHRMRRWHVFPFTALGVVEHQVRLRVLDGRMHGCVGVDLFAQSPQGEWGAPIQRATDRDGTVALTIRSHRYQHYALVVGPREGCDFLPRYPGRRAQILVDRKQAMVDLVLEPNGQAVLVDGRANERWRIEDPLTHRRQGENVDPSEQRQFFAVDSRGERKSIEVKRWNPSVWVAGDKDGAHASPRLLTSDASGLRLVSAPGSKAYERARLVEALDQEGQPLPLTLNNISVASLLFTAPIEHYSTTVQLGPMVCRQLGSCLKPFGPQNRTLPADTRPWRPIAYEPDEPSRYMVTFACNGAACSPNPGVTRYPIYFAHGFNSSRQMWAPVIDAVLDRAPAWRPVVTAAGSSDTRRFEGWLNAENVPGQRPLDDRVEQLRRNLVGLLGQVGGGQEMRINVIAHSMGGLDTRVLIGNPRYNDSGCQAPHCTDAFGRPESCCYQGVPWRQRIASLTTLSSPHLGSAFADWILANLTGSFKEWVFDKVSEWALGLTPEQIPAFKETMGNLARSYAQDVLQRDYALTPTNGRNYDWACAVDNSAKNCQGERYTLGPSPSFSFMGAFARSPATPADQPWSDPQTGEDLLPQPTDETSVYSWASQACLTGICGQLLSPSLVFSYGILRERERFPDGRVMPNDGVVSLASATRGIYMGLRNGDHYDWSNVNVVADNPSMIAQVSDWAFGAPKPKAEAFYLMWLDQLRKAGY